jgi:hypothetical protein
MRWIRSWILESTAEEAPSSTWCNGRATPTQKISGSPNEIYSPHNSSIASTNNTLEHHDPLEHKKTTQPPRSTMARNKNRNRTPKNCSIIPRFHLPTRIMTSSCLTPSTLLRPSSPVPSPPLTPAPEPKEDHILFLPRPPYNIITNPTFHHNVSKSITSYMV